MIVYGPVEQAVKQWLFTTTVAPLVTRGAGVYSIYLAMPPASPSPAVLITLLSGGPLDTADLPQTRYRLQFDVLADTRDSAGLIARTLYSELEWLGRGGPGALVSGVYLGSATGLSMLWLPDPDSDKPRYVVDASITTVT